ncbi:hypothetical protein DVH05_026268 [Phytophthora capsici]|nr:hypothetical protein DVH05_026268 [Phytophthora capsici]
MDRTARQALKRRHHATASDESDDDSEGEEWTMPSRGSSANTSDTSSQFDTQSSRDDVGDIATDAVVYQALAPPLERAQFDSWESFHSYLSKYSARTYQSFRVRTNNKVEERNKKIAKLKTGAPLIPSEWIVYSKTLICTHAGKYKSRGKGKRPRQEVRSTLCGAKINACVRVVNGNADDPVFSLCYCCQTAAQPSSFQAKLQTIRICSDGSSSQCGGDCGCSAQGGSKEEVYFAVYT